MKGLSSYQTHRAGEARLLDPTGGAAVWGQTLALCLAGENQGDYKKPRTHSVGFQVPLLTTKNAVKGSLLQSGKHKALPYLGGKKHLVFD